ILYKKPNKLKIQFSSPSQIDIISDSKSMWIFLKDKNIAIKQPILPKKGNNTIYASELINPYEKYNKEYIIVLEKFDEKFYQFNIRPKPDVFTTFSNAKLKAIKNGLITSISGTTVSKDNVSININYSVINQEIDDREFSFSPPADAQVLVDIFQE
ncbi:MAG: LolA family protein, partial [Brevinematia bacterium]